MLPMRSKTHSYKFISNKKDKHRISRKSSLGSDYKKLFCNTFQFKTDLRYWMTSWFNKWSQVECLFLQSLQENV